MDAVENLRIKYVDYSNLTPNEIRITHKEIEESIVYYPLGNVYYNIHKTANLELIKIPRLIPQEHREVEENWFVERLHDQCIEYAIKFLQVEALKKYIIRNHKSILVNNPFFHLFYTVYPVNKNLEAVKEIIQILVNNYDDYHQLISDLVCPKRGLEYILDIIYDILPDDENNLCSICLKTEPKKFLINICKCTTPTHVKCLVELNKHKPLKNCSVCKDDFKVNEPVLLTKSGVRIQPVNERLFFPHNDIYPQPQMSTQSLCKVGGMSRLTLAIMYLQVSRVKELLKEKEILEELPSSYFGYSGYKQTAIHAICVGSLPSNAYISFGDNSLRYCVILINLLNTGKFDLKQKDAFGKTPMDYAQETKLDFLELVLKKRLDN